MLKAYVAESDVRTLCFVYGSVLFTMIIGPRRQVTVYFKITNCHMLSERNFNCEVIKGTMQGILTMVGGIARCIAPVFVR